MKNILIALALTIAIASISKAQTMDLGGGSSLPPQAGHSGEVLSTNGSIPSWLAVSGTGTVTSVGLTVPAFLSATGSPVTAAGTLAVTLATQTANTIFAGPTSGGASAPTFRSLTAADIPGIDSLLPDQTSNAGKYLTTDGTNSSWATVASTPTGSANTFAGFDNSGNLATIPGWGWNDTTKGAYVVLAYDPIPGSGTVNLYTTDFSASADTTSQMRAYDFTNTIDSSHLNHDLLTSVGTHIGQTFYGNGTLGNEVALNIDQNTGDTTNTGTVTLETGIAASQNINTNSTIVSAKGIDISTNNQGTATGDYVGGAIGVGGNAFGGSIGLLNLNSTASSGGDQSGISVNSAGNSGNNYQMITGQYSGTATAGIFLINLSNQGGAANFGGAIFTNSGNITGHGTGIGFNQQGTIGDGFTLIDFNNNGAITNDLLVYNLNNQSGGTVSRNLYGMNIGNQATVGADFIMAKGLSQGVVSGNSGAIDFNDSVDSAGFYGINIVKSGNTTSNSRDMYGAQISLNGNSARNKTGIELDISGSSASNVAGLQINMQSATATNLSTSISTSGGVLNIGSQDKIRNALGFQPGNQISNNIGVDPGSPVSNTAYISNFLLTIFAFQDDYGSDGGIGIGAAGTGTVISYGVATGKTVSESNSQVAGYSYQAGDGTITDHADYLARGLVGGGSIVTTNAYGFRVKDGFHNSGTNTRGVSIEDVLTPNWLAGNTQIGGSSFSPTASSALDIQSTTGALVLPRMTTAQKNALFPSQGMMVYDTDLNQFSCYSAAWGACLSGDATLANVFALSYSGIQGNALSVMAGAANTSASGNTLVLGGSNGDDTSPGDNGGAAALSGGTAGAAGGNGGALILASGSGDTTAGSAGQVTIQTGAGFNTADILLNPVAASGGTRGQIAFQDGTEGTSGQCWISTDTNGHGSWQACGGGGGANTALSNLASVAINTDLLPDTNNAHDLGSTSLIWRNLFVNAVEDTSGVVSINPGSRHLYDHFAQATVNYDAYTLGVDTTVTVDWLNAYLKDTSGHNVILWDSKHLQDTSNNTSVNWQSRTLNDSTSATALDWSSAGIVSSPGTISADVGVQLTTSGSQPTCDVAHRGLVWNIEGGAGVADILQVCQKNVLDVYTWTTH